MIVVNLNSKNFNLTKQIDNSAQNISGAAENQVNLLNNLMTERR